MDNLKYFVGKACTILTQPTNRFFDETQHTNTFVGIVENIDKNANGLWLLQIPSGKKSFFSFPLVGIVEETVKTFTKEESEQMRKQLESRNLPEKNPQQLIDVDVLKKLKHNTEKK